MKVYVNIEYKDRQGYDTMISESFKNWAKACEWLEDVGSGIMQDKELIEGTGGSEMKFNDKHEETRFQSKHQ